MTRRRKRFATSSSRLRSSRIGRRVPTRKRWATTTTRTWIPRASRASGSRRCAPNWRASTPSRTHVTWRDTSVTRNASECHSRSPGSRSPTGKIRTVYIGAVFQNGLTMPDRDYYLNPEDKYAAVPRQVRDLRRANAGARRRTRREVRRGTHRRAGDAPRELSMDQGRESRPGQDLQPDDAAGVPEARAEFRLAVVLRRTGRAGAEAQHSTSLHSSRVSTSW